MVWVESHHQGRKIYYQIKIKMMKEIDLRLDEIRLIWETRLITLRAIDGFTYDGLLSDIFRQGHISD